MATWRLDQGATDSWDVPAVDADGNPIAYVGDEPLSGDVWPGGTRASLLILAPTWIEPSLGLTRVTIDEVDSALLSAAIYSVRLSVDDGGGPQIYYRGALQILASPGATPGPPSYTDDDDLRTYAPWIDSIQDENSQTGFAKQCGQARAWLDGIIVSRWKPRGGLGPLDPGYNAWLNYGSDNPSKWVKDQLAADTLIVTDLVREIVAKRALYYICRSQLGCNGDHSYQGLARSFRFESEEMVKTLRAELDLDGSGYASVVVNCGATNLR